MTDIDAITRQLAAAVTLPLKVGEDRHADATVYDGKGLSIGGHPNDELEPEAVAAIVAVVNAWPLVAPLAAAAEKWAKLNREFRPLNAALFDGTLGDRLPDYEHVGREMDAALDELLAAALVVGRGETPTTNGAT